MTRWELHVKNWSDCDKCCLAKRRQNIVLARGDIPCDILFIGEAPGHSEDTLGIPFAPGAPAGRLLEEIIDQSVRRFCVCPQEDCIAKPFESMHRPGDLTTVCPNCGRQQSLHLPRLAMTNLTACIPLEEDGSQKFSEPPDECVEACAPRLVDFIDFTNPKVIVCVGRLPADWLDPKYKRSIKLPERMRKKVPLIDIQHPAGILRAPMAARGLMVKKAVITLRDMMEAWPE